MESLILTLDKIDKYILEKDIKNAKINIIELQTQLAKYYALNTLFSSQVCERPNNDNNKIDEIEKRVKNIKDKYKQLLSLPINNCNIKENKVINGINKLLVDYYYLPTTVTPKFLNQREDFDKTLNAYDIDYILLLNKENIVNKLLDNNKVVHPSKKQNRILIITFDDRKNAEYVKIHNQNFSKYAEKYGYDYKYEHVYNQNLNTNPYWYKIYLVKYYLETNLYDYVMWIDSDTMITNMDIEINDIINKYDSDLYFCDDNLTLQKINAGMFIIKNSNIGRSYINDCINNYCSKCVKPGEKKLKGIWAAMCYEQGVMNIVLIKNYMKYATILPIETVFCSNNDYFFKLLNNLFIIHYYDTSVQERNYLFDLINKKMIASEKNKKYKKN